MKENSREFIFITEVMILEGGLTNDKDDSGGKTNYGIASKFHPDVDVEKLTKKKAYQIYSEAYYNYLCEQLPKQLAFIYFDCGINCGVKTANKILQRTLNKVYQMKLVVDGIVGEKTLEALKIINGQCSECELAECFLWERADHYVKISSPKSPHTKKNIKFLRGWLNRLQKVRDFAIKIKYENF